MQLLDRSRFQELVRFGIVGILATAVHYGVYFLALNWFNATIAYSIGYLISFIGNFFLSNYFTFKTQPNVLRGIGFAISHAINYGVHIGLLNLFLWVGLPTLIAPFPVFLIAVPMNFLLVRKMLILNTKPKDQTNLTE